MESSSKAKEGLAMAEGVVINNSISISNSNSNSGDVADEEQPAPTNHQLIERQQGAQGHNNDDRAKDDDDDNDEDDQNEEGADNEDGGFGMRVGSLCQSLSKVTKKISRGASSSDADASAGLKGLVLAGTHFVMDGVKEGTVLIQAVINTEERPKQYLLDRCNGTAHAMHPRDVLVIKVRDQTNDMRHIYREFKQHQKQRRIHYKKRRSRRRHKNNPEQLAKIKKKEEEEAAEAAKPNKKQRRLDSIDEDFDEVSFITDLHKNEKAASSAPKRRGLTNIPDDDGGSSSSSSDETDVEDRPPRPPCFICYVPLPVYYLSNILEQSIMCERMGRIGCIDPDNATLRKRLMAVGLAANIAAFCLTFFAAFAISADYDIVSTTSFNNGALYFDGILVNGEPDDLATTLLRESYTHDWRAKFYVGLRVVAVALREGVLVADMPPGDRTHLVRDFCDRTGDKYQPYINEDMCMDCAKGSLSLVFSICLSLVTAFPSITTDFLRMYPNYDANCQKFFGSVVTFISLLSGIYTYVNFSRTCYGAFDNGIIAVMLNGTVGVDPNGITVLYRFEWSAGIGLIFMMVATMLKIFDIIVSTIIPTPQITRDLAMQQAYEQKYGKQVIQQKKDDKIQKSEVQHLKPLPYGKGKRFVHFHKKPKSNLGDILNGGPDGEKKESAANEHSEDDGGFIDEEFGKTKGLEYMDKKTTRTDSMSDSFVLSSREKDDDKDNNTNTIGAQLRHSVAIMNSSETPSRRRLFLRARHPEQERLRRESKFQEDLEAMCVTIANADSTKQEKAADHDDEEGKEEEH